MIALELPPKEVSRLVSRFQPNRERMERIASFCYLQTRKRFQTSGASGGQPWAKRWPMGGTSPLLAGFLDKFHTSATPQTATLACDGPGAALNQLGTRGKGGVLPDIKPKKAKALFIPLTDRAKSSITIRTRNRKRVRVGQRENSSGLGYAGLGRDLIRGKIVRGKVVPANADFIFLSKVSIPPRGMLPNSAGERTDLAWHVADTLKS